MTPSIGRCPDFLWLLFFFFFFLNLSCIQISTVYTSRVTIVGSKKAREVVFSVLRDACADGDLSHSEALEAVKDIFADNAKQLYKLDASAKFVISENSTSDPSSKLANKISDVVESNAKHFYNLNAVNPIILENGTCPHSLKVATQSSEQDVSFVRIIWVDTSGQHRCRVCYFCFCIYLPFYH